MTRPQVLLAVQEHDLEIRRIEHRLEGLPEKRAILEVRRKIAEVNTLRGKAEELAHRHTRSIAEIADEVASVSEKMAAVQEVLDSGSVSNPKEVHNLAREMDSLRRRTDKLENDQLRLMERLEKAQSQITTIDSALKSLASREKAALERFRQKGVELMHHHESHTSERARLATLLEADVRERYESLRELKGGIGAAKLENTMCTGCRVDLPRERLHELLNGPDVGTCPSCRRLLVVRGAIDE